MKAKIKRDMERYKNLGKHTGESKFNAGQGDNFVVNWDDFSP